ncbi:DUF3515 domain-containing protein [Streptomyces durbertensis]|uniref:DUF3515 domain-containing protein n=1 Tax=Streptomyces durbertensis TaxID=2448886 RepID=A0ABR6EJR6_9ACTN|nr:DUF3515 domain-containing protein [Streptomyces durbertensis]MBB1245342.1 DUF3515 domain-containing protein [Streptomyces durbertensis]
MKTVTTRRLVRAGVLAVCATALTACAISTDSYNVSAAPGGESSQCADLVGSAPERLAGHEREDTNQKGTAVWGSGHVVLRCGNISNVPDSAPCSSVNGVDWVVNEERSRDGERTVLTYGREPAAEIRVAKRVGDQDAVIGELSGIVSEVLTRQKSCEKRD